jgi:hypothetical protein
VPPVHGSESAPLDPFKFVDVDLGRGMPSRGAVEQERLHHGLVGEPLDSRSAAVQVARREGEHFGRLGARDVRVRVPPQVAADVHAEDALRGVVHQDGAADVVRSVQRCPRARDVQDVALGRAQLHSIHRAPHGDAVQVALQKLHVGGRENDAVDHYVVRVESYLGRHHGGQVGDVNDEE